MKLFDMWRKIWEGRLARWGEIREARCAEIIYPITIKLLERVVRIIPGERLLEIRISHAIRNILITESRYTNVAAKQVGGSIIFEIDGIPLVLDPSLESAEYVEVRSRFFKNEPLR